MAKTPMSATDHDEVGGSSDGFTLFELLAVLTIVAIVLGVVMHLMPAGAGASGVRAGAADLANALRSVRVSAINTQREQVALIDVERRQVRFSHTRGSVTLDRSLKLSVTSADSERTGGSGAGIRFYPNGSSSGGTVVLRKGQLAYDVRVNWLTGKVSAAPLD